MSGLWIAFWWLFGIVCFALYSLIGVALTVWVTRTSWRFFDEGNHRPYQDSPDDAEFAPLAGVLWPVAIWFCIGWYLSRQSRLKQIRLREERKERDDLIRRAKKELNDL